MEPQQKLPPVSELFRSTWSLYGDRFPAVMGAGIVPVMLLSMGGLALTNGLDKTGLIFSVLGVIGYLFYGPALLSILQRGTNVRESYRFAVKNFFPYIWISLLVNLVLLGGVVMAVIPVFIFYVWFAFAIMIFVAEGRRGMDALMASKAYVRSYFWPTIGRIILFGIAIAILTGIVSWVLSNLASIQADVVNPLLQLFIVPLLFSYMVVIYNAFRVLKPDVGALTVFLSGLPSGNI